MGAAPSCSLLDGLLVVNKEAGWTSHDVVAKIRHMLGGTKVGHAGTLDPAATGVLPVLIGKGTRIAEYLVEWDKEYRAVLRLGEATDTQDATGSVLARQATDSVTPSAILEVVRRFRGAIEQVPPMYSAVKVSGVPLYKSARAGKTVPRDARTVFIHELEVDSVEGRDVRLRVACSKGTYVRTLCADIGAALGVGGHLLTLERCRVGPLTIAQALTVDEVGTRYALGQMGEAVWPLERILKDLPALVVDEQTGARVRHGVPVPALKILRWEWSSVDETKSDMAVRIHDADGRLLAIGRKPQGEFGTVPIEKVLVGQE